MPHPQFHTDPATRRPLTASPFAIVTVVALLLTACGQPAPEGDTATALGAKNSRKQTRLLPLGAVRVPTPVNGSIKNQAAAVRLGKALFWDMQVGSDGQTACASCHYAGGGDNRTRNTVNPGPNLLWEAVSGPGQDLRFDLDDSDADGLDHETLAGDDIAGSQGVALAKFQGISSDPETASDVCITDPTSPFGMHRQVTGRNSPTVIGAVFNREQFWDGRAHHLFNGYNPFGNTRNATDDAKLTYDPRKFRPDGNLANRDRGNSRDKPRPFVVNSSLASQAVGPVNNDVEMACAGRKINGQQGLGAKLLARKPLKLQQVDPTDSVLGALADPSGGLSVTYRQMIREAFPPFIANSPEVLFSVIFGEAVQAYESTLIPDRTPFDQFLAGNLSAMTAQQKTGFEIFQGRGGCMACHAGSELSDATVSFYQANGARNVNGGDQGFHNIGVRPTEEDLGRASPGPAGQSFSRSGSRADRGAFKTPQLRNVALTAPYFHNGGKATMHDVVDFYEDGPDFDNPEVSSHMKNIDLKSEDHEPLEDFLLNALLDCRVVLNQAPFDHPSLSLPNGTDLPAVGRDGHGQPGGYNCQ